MSNVFEGMNYTDKMVVAHFMSGWLQEQYNEIAWEYDKIIKELADFYEEDDVTGTEMREVIIEAIAIAKDNAQCNDDYGNGNFGEITMVRMGIPREYTLQLRFYGIMRCTHSPEFEIREHSTNKMYYKCINEVVPFMKDKVSTNELLVVEAFVMDHDW
jgi:hypothetical protein